MPQLPHHITPLPIELDNYWQVIEEKVCPRCPDSDSDGHCRLGPAVRCQLKAYLPLIAEVILNSGEPGESESIRRLRNVICTRCGRLLQNGQCHGATPETCPLARYYTIIAGAIEATNRRLAALPDEQDLLTDV